jgi:hypothetical protein
LQDEPLIFKVCDAESAFGLDETIGMVYVDLNPLLTAQANADDKDISGIDGWFPLYDTLSGVRGELLISIKLNFIGEFVVLTVPFRLAELESTCKGLA